MRPNRHQAQTPFQKRWPRARRASISKGVSETRERTFTYREPFFSTPTEKRVSLQKKFWVDVRAVFERGALSASIKAVDHPEDKSTEFIVRVTQTREQRRWQSPSLLPTLLG
jgi:hypothetical protein